MNIKQIMLKAYPKEDKAFSKEIKALDKQIKDLRSARADLAAKCTHPKTHITIHNDGWYIPDGWGGENYSGHKFRAKCDLCGEYSVGTLEPNNLKESTEVHVIAYTKAQEAERKKREKFYEQYEREQEIERLKQLQEKYPELTQRN